MTETEILSDEQLKEIEAWVGLAKEYQSDEHPLTDAARNIDALCQTVRALRADNNALRKINATLFERRSKIEVPESEHRPA